MRCATFVAAITSEPGRRPMLVASALRRHQRSACAHAVSSAPVPVLAATRRSEITKPHIGDVRPFRRVHLQHHVDACPRCVDCQATYKSALKTGHVKADRPQTSSEQHVLLETIAARLRPIVLFCKDAKSSRGVRPSMISRLSYAI